MHFLLIGGDGYLGQVLQWEILIAGHSFTVYDNNLYGLSRERIVSPTGDGEVITADTLDLNGKIYKHSKDSYDIIVNLAAVVGDPACLVDTRFALKNNCVGTRNIVAKAIADDKPIIHFSTCSLYGAEKCTLKKPLKEGDPTFPIDFYGQTKYQQERFVVEGTDKHCVFRLGTATGQSPRMRYDLVIPSFTAKATRDKKIIVFGGGQYRPFVHVRDVARAVIFSADNNLRGIYNLANENLTITQVANKIKKALPQTIVETNSLIQDPRNYIVDGTKLLKKGFKYEWTVLKGIKEMMSASTIKEYDRVIYHQDQLMQLKKMNIKI